MSDYTRPETIEQMCAQTIVRRSAAIATRLRSAAERIEREASRIDGVGKPGFSSYASIASSVQNEIRGLFGNLQFDGLTTDASDADQARQRRIAAETIAGRIDAKVEAIRAEATSPSAGMALGAVAAVGADVAREYAAKEA
jgi:hypothetical protein